MPSIHSIDLQFTGDYALQDSVSLAYRASFVWDTRRQADVERGILDLAVSLEGTSSTVGVRVEQRGGRVRAVLLANPDGAAVDDLRAHLQKILCLDFDGDAFEEVCARDNVLDRLYKLRLGVRPVLFPSPYEAAARAIIRQQLPVRVAAAIHVQIAKGHEVAVTLDDATLHAFPTPARLAGLPPVRGLSERKVEYLRELGRAAVDAWVATARLRAMEFEQAMSHLQGLPGIGLFSAELIVMRGDGDPDAFPHFEKRLHPAMAVTYDLGMSMPSRRSKASLTAGAPIQAG